MKRNLTNHSEQQQVSDYDREFWGDGQGHSEQHLNMVQGEPVAWGYFDSDGKFMDALERQHGAYQTPLFTTPPVVQKGEPVAYMDAVDTRLVCVAPKRKGWLTEREDKEWRKFHADNQYNIPLYTTPPSVEAAIEETKEKAAQICEDCSDHIVGNDLAAQIRSMK